MASTFAEWAPEKVKYAFVAGDAADTDIAVSGIATDDILLKCYENDTHTDRLSTSSITSAGNIQCSDITTGNTLYVEWVDVSA